jgi:hypothetical protein
MVTPATGRWLRPKGDDEWEDMACDALRILWGDRDAKRYGRSGQAQYGIDAYGSKEASVGAGILVGQFYNTDTPGIGKLNDDLAKTTAFPQKIARYYFCVSAARDARFQDEIMALSRTREAAGKFAIVILFFDDVCGELSKIPAHVAKYCVGELPAAKEIKASGAGSIGRLARIGPGAEDETIVNHGPGPAERIEVRDGAIGEVIDNRGGKGKHIIHHGPGTALEINLADGTGQGLVINYTPPPPTYACGLCKTDMTVAVRALPASGTYFVACPTCRANNRVVK